MQEVIKTDWKTWTMAILVIGLILGMTFGVVNAMGDNVSIEKNKVAVFVYDEHGNAIENATVQIISNTSQIIKTGTTDSTGKVILDLNGMANFTGIVKITADGYKTAQENITYTSTAQTGQVFIFHLEKDHSKYYDKAKDIYTQHKTAVLIGGGIVLLLVLLIVFGRDKKIKW